MEVIYQSMHKCTLTYHVHVEVSPSLWGMPCSSLELQESACQHHPFPSTEIGTAKS